MLKGAQVKNGLILAFVLYFAKQIIREFQEFEDTDVFDNEISIPIQPFKAEIPMESNGAKYGKTKKKGGKKNEIELLRKKKIQAESERDVSSVLKIPQYIWNFLKYFGTFFESFPTFLKLF